MIVVMNNSECFICNRMWTCLTSPAFIAQTESQLWWNIIVRWNSHCNVRYTVPGIRSDIGGETMICFQVKIICHFEANQHLSSHMLVGFYLLMSEITDLGALVSLQVMHIVGGTGCSYYALMIESLKPVVVDHVSSNGLPRARWC